MEKKREKIPLFFDFSIHLKIPKNTTNNDVKNTKISQAITKKN
jgi:hypothetical protein